MKEEENFVLVHLKTALLPIGVRVCERNRESERARARERERERSWR